MSTKSSLFLTVDNEHCYEETIQQHQNEDGTHKGYTIVLEMAKKNIRITEDEVDEAIIIEIDPGSELYELVKMMRN